MRINVKGDEQEELCKLATDIKASMGAVGAKWQIMEHMHVSLSRTLYLKVFQIDPFIQAVKLAVKDIKRYEDLSGRGRLTLSRFKIALSHFAGYVNDERTRSFLGVDIGMGMFEVASENQING